MKLFNLDIKGLYGRYDFHLTMDERVNVLAGINGAFKSTLLNIVNGLTLYGECKYPADRVSLEYNYGYKFLYRKEKTNDYEIKYFNAYDLNGNISSDDFRSKVKLSFISTFDVIRETKTDESQLDTQLKELQSEYGYYLSDLAKRITNYINKFGTISREQLRDINYNKDIFISIINEAFSGTGKVLVEDESKLTFILGNKKIFADSLSSGEKQFLIIMLKILLTDNQEYIILLDEPEISLHIGWQYNLIDNMIKLNPNAQFIISTHSPGIFGNGWGDKIIYLDQIKVDNEAGRVDGAVL